MTSPSDRLASFAEVLFTDKALIAVNKRPGVCVIPGRGDGDSLSLREMVEREFGKKIYVVHRIDRETSGVVVFCSTAEMHRRLSMQFEKRTVRKEYRALVEGIVSGTGLIDAPIRQFGSGRMGVDTRNGKPSLTEITAVEQLGGAALVNVQPATGRRHQIRVHLYHSGHPVMGDTLYGCERPVGGVERMMLHAAAVTFAGPEGEPLTITAPVDFQWKEIVQRFSPHHEPDRGGVCS